MMFVFPPAFIASGLVILEISENVKRMINDFSVFRIFKRKNLMNNILIILILIPQILWLVFSGYPSTYGYTNELFNDGSKEIQINDTGYSIAVEWLSKHYDHGNVSASYNPELLEIEFAKRGIKNFNVIGEVHIGDFAIGSSTYLQRHPNWHEELDGWTQIYVVKSGLTTLAYIFKSPQSSI
ncbi:MAG: hypothetical protein HWN67_22075 [Candidatus Helarchaeota archaeon]|nr:hypothetical protein [Candidatus Helarchaeota archaeon]